jgi:hypothetical protein
VGGRPYTEVLMHWVEHRGSPNIPTSSRTSRQVFERKIKGLTHDKRVMLVQLKTVQRNYQKLCNDYSNLQAKLAQSQGRTTRIQQVINRSDNSISPNCNGQFLQEHLGINRRQRTPFTYTLES